MKLALICLFGLVAMACAFEEEDMGWELEEEGWGIEDEELDMEIDDGSGGGRQCRKESIQCRRGAQESVDVSNVLWRWPNVWELNAFDHVAVLSSDVNATHTVPSNASKRWSNASDQTPVKISNSIDSCHVNERYIEG